MRITYFPTAVKLLTYAERQKKLLNAPSHPFSVAPGLALTATLVLGGVTPLPAGPQIAVNGNLVTRSNEALPLKVIHGKAVRLGDDLPALTADLFEPVYLHSKIATANPTLPAPSNDSFYDTTRDDGLPIKESIPVTIVTAAPAPVVTRPLVRLEPELPRLDPMVMSGRLTLAQIPAYAASEEATEQGRHAIATGMFADLKPRVESTQATPSSEETPVIAAASATPPEPENLDNIDGLAAPGFSLASVAQEKAFLDSAWVNYDENDKEFKATWSKPPLFHYGMVLLPELAKRVQSGQEVEFRYKDMPAKLTKDDKGRLFVTAAGEARLVTAGKLKKLLEEKIETDGMILFLDRSGNLVLHASGQSALVMNHHATR